MSAGAAVAGELYFCCDERRRAKLRDDAANGGTRNGIDFLEVTAHTDGAGNPLPNGAQRRLQVHFVVAPSAELRARLVPGAAPPYPLSVEGGDRVRGVRVEHAAWEGDALCVDVDPRGDYSTYTLRVAGAGGLPVPGMDPILSAVDFSFKVECPTPGDCRPRCDCPPAARDEPEIDYLAKDYASFRQLMLDRMSLVLPGWRERSPADLGIMLVELLAYVGDYLSYEQDAVATEAYLGTARRRTSVRRHARLLDYPMHDGCNARAWVHIELAPAPEGDPDAVTLRRGTELYTRLVGAPVALAHPSSERDDALAAGPAVFETVHEVTLRASHNTFNFWAHGRRECCLPRGATRAALDGHHPTLRPGDVLVFEEVKGPETGAAADADAGRRHAVRLTRVDAWRRDDNGDETNDELTDLVYDVPITLVEWHRGDALPIPLCLSATTAPERGGQFVDRVSVARGNVVLADHGLTICDGGLGAPPAGDPLLAPAGSARCACDDVGAEVPPGRFRPRLREGPLTQVTLVRRPTTTPPDEEHLVDAAASAAAARRTDPVRALPALAIYQNAPGGVSMSGPWLARRDLLSSGPLARDVVAEVDDDGRAELRFGDNVLGERPEAELPLLATYRVGNGTTGNVGADALAHLATGDATLAARVVRVRNPLPAVGGTDPESVERVRQVAPAAFRVPARAVTPADYARMAERHPEVQRAAATLRWTGSWRTVFLTVDRAGGLPVDDPFEAELRRHLERYRMAGHDLEVDGPRWVPLEVELFICVAPGYFRGDVERALRETLGSRALPDGRLGFFHPDRFTFEQSVFLSRLYAAAQGVAGVSRVEVRTFQRQRQPATDARTTGELHIGRLEIARLDDDPNHRDRGELRIHLEGGR